MNTSNRNLCVCATTMHISLCADYAQKKANPALPVEYYSLADENWRRFFCVLLFCLFVSFERPPNRQLICLSIWWGNCFRPVNKDIRIHCKYCLLIEKTWGWADEDVLTNIYPLLFFYSTITKRQHEYNGSRNCSRSFRKWHVGGIRPIWAPYGVAFFRIST